MARSPWQICVTKPLELTNGAVLDYFHGCPTRSLGRYPQLGSSRHPGKQWTVRVRRGPAGVVASWGLARRDAEELAERLNELFNERPGLAPQATVCDLPIAQASPTGRPRLYCSAACSQGAYLARLRQGAEPRSKKT